MANLISYVARYVKPKGLNPDNKPQDIDQYLLDDDLKKLDLIKKIPKIKVGNPTIFYPGCGADILFPLHYLQIFNPKEVSFVFMDINNEFHGQLINL